MKLAKVLLFVKKKREVSWLKSCVGLCFEILPTWLLFQNHFNNIAVKAKTLRHSRSKNYVKSSKVAIFFEVEWHKLREIAERRKKIKRYNSVRWKQCQKLREIAEKGKKIFAAVEEMTKITWNRRKRTENQALQLSKNFYATGILREIIFWTWSGFLM